jgi:hypothetical protein
MTGMGAVVAATHLRLGELVAVKLLLPAVAEDPQSCFDGVCCNVACNGACLSCNQAGKGRHLTVQVRRRRHLQGRYRRELHQQQLELRQRRRMHHGHRQVPVTMMVSR